MSGINRHERRNKPVVLLSIVVALLVAAACTLAPNIAQQPAPVVLNESTSTPAPIPALPATIAIAAATSTPTAVALQQSSTPAANAAPAPDQSLVPSIFYVAGKNSPWFRTDLWSLNPATGQQTRLYSSAGDWFRLENVAVSPDGRSLVINSITDVDPTSSVDAPTLASALLFMASDGSGQRILAETSNRSEEMFGQRWSPDGSQLSYVLFHRMPAGQAPQSSLHVIAMRTGSDRVVSHSGGESDWSPDGKQLVYVGPWADNLTRSHLYLLDLSTGQEKSIWQSDGMIVGKPVWRPGSDEVAVPVVDKIYPPSRDANTGVYLINVASGHVRKMIDAFVEDLYWSPDGKKLAFVSDLYWDFMTGSESRLGIFNTETGWSTGVIDYQVVRLGTATWSKDGNMLLVGLQEGSSQSYAISLVNVANNNIAELVTADTWDPAPAW